MPAAPTSSLWPPGVPRDDHASGTLEAADSIREAHPRVAANDINGTAVLGDHAEVERLLAADAGRATAPGGPYRWEALTYLCSPAIPGCVPQPGSCLQRVRC